jgi:hypothetical protein
MIIVREYTERCERNAFYIECSMIDAVDPRSY